MVNMFSMGMMGMPQGNVYQNMLNKYGYDGDFRSTPQAIKYTPNVLPKGRPEIKTIPATFWGQMAKFYYFK